MNLELTYFSISFLLILCCALVAFARDTGLVGDYISWPERYEPVFIGISLVSAIAFLVGQI